MPRFRTFFSLALAAWVAACGGTVRHNGPNGGAGPTGGTSSGGSQNPTSKPCEYDGNSYASGDVVPMGECSSCSCSDGDIACTLLPCDPQGCSYQGKFYKVGESFPASDGCNSCSCMADQSIGCTEIGCPSDACQMLKDKYSELLSSAAACMRNEECTVRMPSTLPCGCDRWVTANDMMLVYQATLVADQYKMQCPTDLGCPDNCFIQDTGFCYQGRCVLEVLPK